MNRDEGTSLVELVVGMTLMMIFLAMFTGAAVMMNTAMSKSQAVNVASSQINIAYLNLDTTVRYASYIGTPASTPAVGTGNWYVEFQSTTSGTEACTQLRVDKTSRQLQVRTWTVLNATASSPSAWVPIASGISNGGAVAGATSQPFYRVAPGENTVFQQLTVTLISPAGPASSISNSMSSFTFTALNSVVPAPTSSICLQWGRP